MLRKKEVIVLVGILIFAACSGEASTLKVLHTFSGGSDGNQPYAGLIFDPAGNLYGTTQFGGTHAQGTVFRLTHTSTGWREKVLHSFAGAATGLFP